MAQLSTAAVGVFVPGAGGAGFSGLVAGDWGAYWVGGGGVHPADGEAWGAAVSGWRQRGLEAAADTDRWFAGDGLPAVPVFPQCAWERGAADQGGAVCA